MIERIAKWVVKWLTARGVIDEEQSDVYVYGADTLVYTIVSTAGLLVAGAFCHHFWETVLIITLYYINQTTGGGYHATTHLRCFFTMLISLILSLSTYYFPIIHWVGYISVMFSFIILMIIPLVLHPNKGYLGNNQFKLIKRSRAIVVIESLAILVLMVVNINVYTRACCLGLLVSAISRLVGHFYIPSSSN